MNRIAELLTSIAGRLRGFEPQPGTRLFRDVRVELDRYDLADLVSESTSTPAARVCFLAGKPVKRPDGGEDMDVSVAIIVVAGREGRANPDFASADLAALDLVTGAGEVLAADPYVGLVKLGAADLGQSLVAVSEATGKKGIAIALLEAKWRLLEMRAARPLVRAGLGTGTDRAVPAGYAINDGETVALDPEAGP